MAAVSYCEAFWSGLLFGDDFIRPQGECQAMPLRHRVLNLKGAFRMPPDARKRDGFGIGDEVAGIGGDRDTEARNRPVDEQC